MRIVRDLVRNLKDPLPAISAVAGSIPLHDFLIGAILTQAEDAAKAEWFARYLVSIDPQHVLSYDMLEVTHERDRGSLVISVDYKEFYQSSDLFSYTLYMYDEFSDEELDEDADLDSILSKIVVFNPSIGDSQDSAIDIVLDPVLPIDIQLLPVICLDRDRIIRYGRSVVSDCMVIMAAMARAGTASV